MASPQNTEVNEMKTTTTRRTVCGLIAATMLVAWRALPLTIETVPVGNAGNLGEISGTRDPALEDVCGAVDYEYSIGKYEITAGQYTEFLNAVAVTDTYELYHTNMDTGTDSHGCNIKRSGTSGSYSYSVAGDWADRPVNYVSWGDAARFANWMHNGQPTGSQNATTTEDGTYFLDGATSGIALTDVDRRAVWVWAIPTEDEWYKAAYYDPSLNGGTGGYWDYPTRSDAVPSNDLVEPDPGNNATFSDGSYTIDGPYYRTEVGEHENSDSAYGTFDQGGNTDEWAETITRSEYAVKRGGGYALSEFNLRANARTEFRLESNHPGVGFRLALNPNPVPEPTSAVLFLLIGLLALVRL